MFIEGDLIEARGVTDRSVRSGERGRRRWSAAQGKCRIVSALRRRALRRERVKAEPLKIQRTGALARISAHERHPPEKDVGAEP
jgi:hypothetical protein